MNRLAFLTEYKFRIGLGLLAIVGIFVTFFLITPQTNPNPQAGLITQKATATPTTLATPTPTPTPTATLIPPTPTIIPSPTPIPPTPTPFPTPTPIPFFERFDYRLKDRVTEVKPGVTLIHRELTSPGPLKINIMLFDIKSPEFNLRVVSKNGYLSGVSRTTDLLKANKGALAAVNGDLFSGQGLPQGLMISDGKLAMAPKYRATFAWSKDRQPFIGYFTDNWTWPSSVSAENGESHSIELLNTPCLYNWLCIYNNMYRSISGNYGDIKILIDPEGKVAEIETEGKALKIPEDYFVLLARQGTESFKWLKSHAKVGKSLYLNLKANYNLDDYTQAVSGGPIILKNGQFVQDCLCNLGDCSDTKELKGPKCEEFPTEWKLSHYLTVRMPRTAVGFNDKKDTLVVIQSDGYQPGFSIGMTQKELAALFVEFGATTAMELDGGGSSTMSMDNKLLSHPSDGSGTVERQVPNAVVFYWYENKNDLPGDTGK